MHYPHIAARLFNTPLLIHPQKLDAIIAGLGDRLLGTGLEMPAELQQSMALPAEMFSTRAGKRGDDGYTVTDGVGIVFASGALVHRTRMDADSTYLLGYNTLARQLEAAMDNPEVHAVLQIMDTPGGEVAGAFEYGDRIHALRGKKPMWAIADTLAASAGYLGGSAFDKLAISSTGYVGSIGVVMRHVDMSRRLANEGIQVTHIIAGDHKIDGNPYEPLPKNVQADLQEEINGIYTMFVDAVVRNRKLNAQAVRETQAAVFRGQAAVALGLADRVATTDQLISELAALRARSFPVGQTARSTANGKGETMSGNTTGGQQAATTAASSGAAFTQADLDAVRAEGLAQGQAQGAQAERDRVAAVRSMSMKGHEALIEKLAADGKTTGPEAAMAVLAAERAQQEAAGKAFVENDAPQPAKSGAAPSDQPKTKTQQVAEAKAYSAEHKVDFVTAMKKLGFVA